MAVQYAQLRRIDNSRSITEETDGEFLHLLRSALLLALLERGELSDAAHRLAVEKLRQQRCARYKPCKMKCTKLFILQGLYRAGELHKKEKKNAWNG